MKHNNIQLPEDYNALHIVPKNTLVKVIDSKGNVGNAYPTYYPFKIEKSPGDELKPKGFRATPVPCEPFWDGGWLIQSDDNLTTTIGEIIGWRYI